MQKRQFKIDTPIGELFVLMNKTSVLRISVIKDNTVSISAIADIETETVARQLLEYFEGNRRVFDFSIDFSSGTPFQKRVWKELCNIPYGSTVSYGDIALSIGQPHAARAVGMACNRNPLLIVVPCHRVVGKNRKLIGFACGLYVKRYLLNMECDLELF